MNKFLITLKYNLLNTLAINKLRKKSNPKKFSILKILLIIFLAIALFGVSFSYLFMFGEALNSVGTPELVLSMGIFFGIILSIIFTITNASSYLFKSKDFDLLMSLPIKERTIVFTKVSYILIINYVLFLYIYIPSLIVYSLYVKTNAIFWFLAIIAYFLIPLFPVSISTFFAYLFSMLMPKFKYKNLFTIIFSFFLIGFIMVLSFSSSMVTADPTGFSKSLTKILNITGQWAYNGIRGNYLDYLYLILISVVSIVVLIRFAGMFYLKANTKLSTSITKSNFKMVDLNIQNQNITLIKKELKRYFSSPMYVLNTMIGPLLSIIFIIVFKVSITANIEGLGLNIEDLSFMPAILLAMIIVSLAITSTTASSISIEGKQFWILKSAPLKASQVFHGKIFVNLIVTIPFLLINTVVIVFLFNFKFIDILMIFLIPLLITLFMSYIGLYVNLLLPRFDYDSDVKAVKQSLSVLITSGIGFLISALSIGLGAYVIIKTGLNIYGYLTGLGIGLVAFGLAFILLYKHGSSLYHKIVI